MGHMADRASLYRTVRGGSARPAVRTVRVVMSGGGRRSRSRSGSRTSWRRVSSGARLGRNPSQRALAKAWKGGRRTSYRGGGRGGGGVSPALARAMFQAASQIKMGKKLAFWEKMNKLDIHTKAEANLYQLRHRQAIQLAGATRRVGVAAKRLSEQLESGKMLHGVEEEFKTIHQEMEKKLEMGLDHRIQSFQKSTGLVGLKTAKSANISSANTRGMDRFDAHRRRHLGEPGTEPP